jgi:hypothetical protein
MDNRPQKITSTEMRDMGARGLQVYCSDVQPPGHHEQRSIA